MIDDDRISVDYYVNMILEAFTRITFSTDEVEALQEVVRSIAQAEYDLGHHDGVEDSTYMEML